MFSKAGFSDADQRWINRPDEEENQEEEFVKNNTYTFLIRSDISRAPLSDGNYFLKNHRKK